MTGKDGGGGCCWSEAVKGVWAGGRSVGSNLITGSVTSLLFLVIMGLNLVTFVAIAVCAAMCGIVFDAKSPTYGERDRGGGR